MKNWLTVVLIVALVVFAGIKVWNHFHMPELPIGKTTLLKADGSQLETNNIKQPYLLISCFQSWCGDCIRESPSIKALQEKVGEEKLAVLLVSDEDWGKINRFSQLSKTGLPVYQSNKSLNELGVRVFPSTWLLGPERKILLAKLEGYDWNSAEVQALIQ